MSLLRLHWDALEDGLPDRLLFLLTLHDVEVRVLLQLGVKLGDEVPLEALLPLLLDVDVDVVVAPEHGLASCKHHHRAHCEVLKLVLAKQTLGGENEQNTQTSIDLNSLDICYLNVIYIH